MITCFHIKTPLGIARICGDPVGISSIGITDTGISEDKDMPEELKEAVAQLMAYFNGELKEFTFKLNLKGTPFQQKVWKALKDIPYGQTISYLDLAGKLGDVKAIRAVAAANGKNPVWIVVPCHRVIGSDGSLTGYAGGLFRKKWLLDHENPPLQQSLF